MYSTVYFFKLNTAYVLRIRDVSSDVCSSDLVPAELDHQRDEPHRPESDVQPVRSDEGEEGRAEGAALRCRADLDHVVELRQLDAEEGEAEQAGNCDPPLGSAHLDWKSGG